MDIALDLDPNSPTYKDVKISNGDLVKVTGKDAILQDILQTLGFFLGEWFLDIRVGVPYFQTILVKNPNQTLINAALINAILNVAGVTQITKYKFAVNAQSRILSVYFTAQTTDGIVNYSGLINGG